MQVTKSKLALSVVTFIVIRLMRLSARVERFLIERGAINRTLLVQYMDVIVRDTSVLPEVDEDTRDRIVFTAILKMLLPELLLEDHPYRMLAEEIVTNESLVMARKKVRESNEQIDSIVAQTVHLEAISKCRCQFWLLLHVRFLSKNSEYAEFNLSRARKLDGGIKPLTLRTFISIRRKTRRNIKQITEQIIDREAAKIDINFSRIAKCTSFIVALFVPAGYLYNHFLLGDFGIHFSNHFTVSDYLASSVDAIHQSITNMISFLVGTILALSYFSEEHARKTLESKYRIFMRGLPRFPSNWYFSLALLILTSVAYFRKLELYYGFIGMFFLTIIAALCDKFSIRYFKQPLIVRTAILAISVFTISLWTTAESRAFRLRNGIEHDRRTHLIRFERGHSAPSSELVILASTTNYYILISRELQAFIVHRSAINRIDIDTGQHPIREWIPDL